MSASLPIEAIRCQLREIVRFALDNDQARLRICCDLRDALAAVERDATKRGHVVAPFSPSDQQSLESLDQRTSRGDASGADRAEYLEHCK
jgi:hypothetical protein